MGTKSGVRWQGGLGHTGGPEDLATGTLKSGGRVSLGTGPVLELWLKGRR